MTDWTGNMTVKVDKREDTFSAGVIEAKRYGQDAISLQLTSGDGRASVLVRFTGKDCKLKISKLLATL